MKDTRGESSQGLAVEIDDAAGPPPEIAHQLMLVPETCTPARLSDAPAFGEAYACRAVVYDLRKPNTIIQQQHREPRASRRPACRS